MVWGDFEGCKNVVLADGLLRYQKRFAEMIAGRCGLCHHDPLFSQHGMLKIADLYRQQLRVHAWRFWRGRLPENQAAMLVRAGDVHGHATRAARSGLFVSSRDHKRVGYRVPVEWGTLTEGQRATGSLAAFKRGSRGGFLAGYGSFVCHDAKSKVCAGGWVG